MSKFLTFIISLAFISFTSLSFANIMGTDKEMKTTNLTGHWHCTTNASSSDVEADKLADKEMSEMKKSAADAYAFAAKHCRDCTKITCEYEEENGKW